MKSTKTNLNHIVLCQLRFSICNHDWLPDISVWLFYQMKIKFFQLSNIIELYHCVTNPGKIDSLFLQAAVYIERGEARLHQYPQIFNKVETFIQRCQDMVEICEAMIVFGR